MSRRKPTPKRGRGIGNAITGIVWTLIIIGMVVGALQVTRIDGVGGLLSYLRNKSNELAECVPNGTCDLTIQGPNGKPSSPSDRPVVDLGDLGLSDEESGYKGPAGGEPYIVDEAKITKDGALQILNTLEVKDDVKVDYSRKEWKHWSKVPGRQSCWNTRKEVLYRDAVPGTIKMVDKNKVPTNDVNKACGIGSPVKKDGKIVLETKNSGVWIDPYSGQEMTNAKDIDIDHVIALGAAARTGGQAWSIDEKEAYANDLGLLLATSAKENRSKGDKTPGDYMPSYKPYKCAYAKNTISIANKYNLSINKKDYGVLKSTLLKDCEH